MPEENEMVQESLSNVLSHLLEECRMVLPGIQALFGFQLIAVFNQGFWQNLAPLEQQVHLIAVALVALAVSLVMTPAAYHRQTHPDRISRHFILVSSRFLLWSMFPLVAAICIEFYLLARLILHNTLLSVVFALILAVLFIVPWFLLPRIRSLQRLIQR
jgi:hypothetical protein